MGHEKGNEGHIFNYVMVILSQGFSFTQKLFISYQKNEETSKSEKVNTLVLICSTNWINNKFKLKYLLKL